MLRPATDADVEQMLAWRNQPANREVSNNQHVIGLDEHLAWWERAKQDPTRHDLVFEHDDRPLGVVNFFDHEPSARTASWGFYLDHETTTAEGTAMMAWMQVMKEATSHAFDVLGLEVLNAEVLEDNESVRMMNRRFRFTEGEPFQRTSGDSTITVIPIQLRRENRRGQKK